MGDRGPAKLTLIVALSALTGCQCSERPSSARGPGSGSASVVSTPVAPASPARGVPDVMPDACRIGLVALDQTTCAAPEVRQNLLDAKRAIGGILETIGKANDADPRQLRVMCAQLILAIDHDVTKLRCELALEARHRKELRALLDAWYAQRTPVAPTGDAASDAVIARIAVIRDAACACRDGACLERLDPQLGAVGALPGSAPAAARALAGKLLEDAGRCATRVRTLDDPPR